MVEEGIEDCTSQPSLLDSLLPAYAKCKKIWRGVGEVMNAARPRPERGRGRGGGGEGGHFTLLQCAQSQYLDICAALQVHLTTPITCGQGIKRGWNDLAV